MRDRDKDTKRQRDRDRLRWVLYVLPQVEMFLGTLTRALSTKSSMQFPKRVLESDTGSLARYSSLTRVSWIKPSCRACHC